MGNWGGLPSIVSALPNDVRNFLQRVKETLDGAMSGSNRFVTVSDLVNGDVAALDRYGNVVNANAGMSDFTPPPAPTGLTASGALTTIMLQWDDPLYANLAHAEVWRASVDNQGLAVLIGTSSGVLYPDPVDAGSTYYYWVRFVSKANVFGAFNAISGVHGVTSADPAQIIDILTANAIYTDTPYYYQATPTTINGVEVSVGTYVRDAYIANGTISNAKIGNAAIDDAKIISLSAAKITFGEMSGDRITANSLAADRIKAGTLLAGSWIKVQAPGATYGTTIHSDGYIVTEGAIDKTVLTDGNVITYRKVGGAEYPYQSLAHVENGVAANNTPVTIPGYYPAQPKVIVSPAALTLYKVAYANQDQLVRCEALDVHETSIGSMIWQFTPKAQLELAAATGNTVLNVASSDGDSNNSWVSATYTTPANTASIDLAVDITSVRGTGTAGQYYLRQVQWRVVYWNGAAWVAGAWKTKAIGSTVSAVSDTNTFAFPSSAAWQFYIEYLGSDAGGTFSTGAPQYNYSTVYRAANGPITYDSGYIEASHYSNPGVNTTLNLGAYTPDAGWEVYGVAYTYELAYYLQATNGASACHASVTAPQVSVNVNNGVIGSLTLSNYSSHSWTAASYDPAIVANTWLGDYGASFDGTGQMKVGLRNGSASISIRQLVTNSTTPSNSSTFQSYSYNLTSSQVLATGTLNWMAIGA